MGRIARVIGAAVALLLVATATATAGGVGHWTQITSQTQGSSDVIGLVRTPDGLLNVAWGREVTPSTQSLYVTKLDPHGVIKSVFTVASGWAGAGDPALAAQSGGLEVFFPGTRTTHPGEPLTGMIQAVPGGASWFFLNIDSRTDDFGYGRVPGVTVVGGDTSLVAWYDTSQPVVKVAGSDPTQRAIEFTQASGGKCCGIDENLATNAASGQVFLAWCQFDKAANGIWVQGVDPTTGGPVGSPMRMPGTATLYHGRLTHLCEIVQPTPLAPRPGGGIFTASTAGYPSTSKVLVWRLGAASSTTVASKHGEDFKVPQMAADPNGRIWVGWMDHSGTVFLRRSNPNATRWGATVRVRPPKGTLDGFELHLSAQAGVVDLLARFQSLHEINVFHIQAHPGLTFSASPLSFSHKDSHTVHFVVRDAGDPVNGAKVKVDGKSDTTNAQGKAEIKLGPFARRRWLTATATAPGYAPAHLRLRAH